MNQIKNDQDKNIETGVRHLARDLENFGDLNYAIMAYNISREHIYAKQKGNATAENEKKLTIGKNYLQKVLHLHAKKLLPLLAGDIDNPESVDYVPAVE